MNAPFWTDGLTVIAQVSANEVSVEDVEFFYWGWDAGLSNEADRKYKRERASQRGLPAQAMVGGESHALASPAERATAKRTKGPSWTTWDSPGRSFTTRSVWLRTSTWDGPRSAR